MDITWVLDWNRIINLLVVLLPFFTTVGLAFKYLLDRADKKDKERREQETEARKKEREEERTRREQEIEEMREARKAFYTEIMAENVRIRDLHEGEQERNLALRNALAEAAQREWDMSKTIAEMSERMAAMERQIHALRAELARAQGKDLNVDTA